MDEENFQNSKKVGYVSNFSLSESKRIPHLLKKKK